MKNSILIILILLLNAMLVFPQSWDQIIKAVASDRAVSDNFGYSVSISGDYAIVGAVYEDEDASGINPLSEAGSAYIFVRSGSTWTQQQKIVALDRAASDYFGYSVSISGDYAIVGAYYEDEDASGSNTLSAAGSAYIFVRSGSTWTQQQKIVASDRAASDNFGYSVSISGDYSIVGAYQEDEDASGGNTLFYAGSAYIFVRSGSTWTQQQKIVASDRGGSDYFSISVLISGDYAIVGAYYEDEDASGGNTLTNAGSAYIFVRSGSAWTQQQKIVASDRAASDNFGISVSISGDYAIVGAYYEDEDASGGNTLSMAGSAYIFVRSGSTWTQQQKIVASDRATSDIFGRSVSISGDYAIVGAYAEDEDVSGGNMLFYAGSAYIFVRSGSTWTQQQKIVASDRAANDVFGYSVSISGGYAIVGAYYEDEDASGINTLSNAGSAYIYSNPEAALPVELVSFNATISGNKITLNWETASEVINYGFEVERSQNDNWVKIGFVQGHGNSNSPKEYSFSDKPNSGSIFKYRLKQIDIDGKFEYSKEVEVSIDIPQEFSVSQNFPNPFNPSTNIKFSIPSDDNVQIKVFNVLGMEVATLLNEHRQAGIQSIEFNASNLSSGIYFYKVVSGNFSEIKKMILLR